MSIRRHPNSRSSGRTYTRARTGPGLFAGHRKSDALQQINESLYLDTSVGIQFIGAATGVDSATLPTHVAGDVILAFAYRDGNATPPTTPTSPAWTEVTAGTGGNINSSVVAWFRAVDGSTTSGTWTDATSVVFMVYRGAKETGSPIGGFSEGGSVTASINFPAFTLTATNSSSWVVGFVGHRSIDVVLDAPSRLVTRTSLVDATDSVAGLDSNRGLATWTSGTYLVGGTASGWRTWALELLKAEGVSGVTTPYANTGSSAQTYAPRYDSTSVYSNTGSGTQSYTPTYSAGWGGEHSYSNTGSGTQAYAPRYDAFETYSNTNSGTQAYAPRYDAFETYSNTNSGTQAYAPAYDITSVYSNTGSSTQTYAPAYDITSVYSNTGTGTITRRNELNWSSDMRTTAEAGTARPWTNNIDVNVRSEPVEIIGPFGNAVLASRMEMEQDNFVNTAQKGIAQSQARPNNTVYTVSCYVKADQVQNLRIIWSSKTPAFPAAVFNLNTGATFVQASGAEACLARSMTDLGNGWWRCQATFDSKVAGGSNTTSQFQLYAAADNYQGLANDGLFIYAPQTELGTGATDYQATQGAFNPYTVEYRALEVYGNTGEGTQSYAPRYDAETPYSNTGSGVQAYSPRHTTETPYSNTGEGTQSYAPRHTTETPYSNTGTGVQNYASSIGTPEEVLPTGAALGKRIGFKYRKDLPEEVPEAIEAEVIEVKPAPDLAPTGPTAEELLAEARRREEERLLKQELLDAQALLKQRAVEMAAEKARAALLLAEEEEMAVLLLLAQRRPKGLFARAG